MQPRANTTGHKEQVFWSSVVNKLSLTLPTNSGIIAAMQRIHYHTGRQAGRPASKQAEGRGRRKRKPGKVKRGKGKPKGVGWGEGEEKALSKMGLESSQSLVQCTT